MNILKGTLTKNIIFYFFWKNLNAFEPQINILECILIFDNSDVQLEAHRRQTNRRMDRQSA